MLAEIARPHHKSPRPAPFPTITLMKYTWKTTAAMTAE